MKVGKFWLIGLSIVILDQLTKTWARISLVDIVILPFFSFTFSSNTGAAFGIFQGNNWIFFFLGLVALGLIFIYYRKMFVKKEAIWWIIITAGIMGNMIDRLFVHYVIDFINFHFWPIFNIADSALTIGVVALLLKSFKSSPPSE